MTQSVSVLKTQIERIVEPTFRRTRHAKFQKPNGWYICDAWFEKGEPRMQMRSLADSLEDAAIVATGIQMAIDWLVEETARGGNLPEKAGAVSLAEKFEEFCKTLNLFDKEEEDIAQRAFYAGAEAAITKRPCDECEHFQAEIDHFRSHK